MTELEEGDVGSWTVYRLPRSLWHCTWANFDWTAVTPKKALSTHLEQWLARALVGEAPHVMLTGTPGIGKSHLGVALYRRAVAAFGSALVTWINVPAFCDALKTRYGTNSSSDLWEDVEEARRVVVLDDLFGKKLSDHEANQIMYRLIDTVYRNNAALMVNMNQDVKELKNRIPRHEISRLLAGGDVIPMASVGDADYRRRR